MPVQNVESRPITKTANGTANEAIKKLVADTEGLTKTEQARLHELLQDFSDVISTGAASRPGPHQPDPTQDRYRGCKTHQAACTPSPIPTASARPRTTG